MSYICQALQGIRSLGSNAKNQPPETARQMTVHQQPSLTGRFPVGCIFLLTAKAATNYQLFRAIPTQQVQQEKSDQGSTKGMCKHFF
jgi:hypothetical protein